MHQIKNKSFCLEDISRYKNEIYGVSILWIMLFHGIDIVGIDYTLGGRVFLKPLNEFIRGGNMGVEIFLFCSGVFLYFSYHRNPDILSFMKKRFLRLFLPVIIISGGYWVWYWIIDKQDLAKFISKVTMLDFWVSGDQQIWFVAFIFVCYLLYPYIYEFLFKSKFANEWVRLICLIGTGVILTLSMANAYPDYYNKIEIAFTRIPVFLIGCFAGKRVYEKRTLPGWTYIIVLILEFFAFYVLQRDLIHGPWRRWFYLVVGVSMTFTTVLVLNVLKCGWLQRSLGFFGKISLNLYVAHIVVIRLYKMTRFFENPRLLHYLVVLVISVLIAWIAEKLIVVITNKSKKVKN